MEEATEESPRMGTHRSTGQNVEDEFAHRKDGFHQCLGYLVPPLPRRAPIPTEALRQAQGSVGVQVLSFNIDEDVSVIAPYMKEAGYTFPVLLARDYVEAC